MTMMMVMMMRVPAQAAEQQTPEAAAELRGHQVVEYRIHGRVEVQHEAREIQQIVVSGDTQTFHILGAGRDHPQREGAKGQQAHKEAGDDGHQHKDHLLAMLPHAVALLMAVAFGAGSSSTSPSCCCSSSTTCLCCCCTGLAGRLGGGGSMECTVGTQQLVGNGRVEHDQNAKGQEEEQCDGAHEVEDGPEVIGCRCADWRFGTVAVGLHAVAGYGNDWTAKVYSQSSDESRVRGREGERGIRII